MSDQKLRKDIASTYYENIGLELFAPFAQIVEGF